MPRNVTVILDYSPTTAHSDEKFDNTLDSVQPTVKKNDLKIIVGGWNAKIGSNIWDLRM